MILDFIISQFPLMTKYIDLLRLKIKGYITIDDFLPDEICDKLRYLALNNKKVDYQWSDYVAKDFDKGDDSYSLKWVADQYISQRVSFVRKESYIRSWSFLYNNKGDGVGPHIDPGSYYTFNMWVTPDECVEAVSYTHLTLPTILLV